jgi:hypothetical protein
MVDFGVCDCGGSLIPVWFTEEETKVANGTIDGPWHNRR